jgi:Protein of unknown function (DUF3108)
MKCFFLLAVIVSASVSAESLHYTINWPSGLSLGEAMLDTAHAKDGGWDFSLDIDASIPGFVVRDHYHAQANSDLCGVVLDKKFVHGSHKNEEHITFDQSSHTATRQTVGGGKSDTSLSSCGREAFGFLQFARNELANGRLVPQQPVLFGAVYNVRMEFTGTQTIRVGEQKAEADRIVATIKGPSSDITVELFFSHDSARVPLLAKIPLPLGTFSVELIR